MFWTSVPKASVNEYGYPNSSEHDVRADSANLGEGQIDTVSESSAVKFASYGHFGGCMHAPHSAHLSRFGS